MITVKVPPALQEALNKAIVSCAMTGDLEGWDRVNAAVQRLQAEDHVEDLGAIIGLIAKEDMPQLVAAIRLGAVLAVASRNEIDKAKAVASN